MKGVQEGWVPHGSRFLSRVVIVVPVNCTAACPALRWELVFRVLHSATGGRALLQRTGQLGDTDRQHLQQVGGGFSRAPTVCVPCYISELMFNIHYSTSI